MGPREGALSGPHWEESTHDRNVRNSIHPYLTSASPLPGPVQVPKAAWPGCCFPSSLSGRETIRTLTMTTQGRSARVGGA